MNELEHASGLAPTPGYRYADVVHGRLYVAGQVPLDTGGNLVSPGDVGAQARHCLGNLFRVIDVHGFGRDDIHHLTIYVVGPQTHLGAAWSAVRDEFESGVPPATLLGVNLLGYEGQLVEIDAHIERA